MNNSLERSTIRMEVPYFQVPNSIFDLNLDINIYHKIVYLYLCRCCNQGAQAFPSYNTIAIKCGMSRRKAIDTVNELIKFNLLVKETRKKEKVENNHKELNDTNLYLLNDPSAYSALPQCTTDTTPVHKVLYPSEHGAPKKETFKKNNKKEPSNKGGGGSNFNNFEQRNYDDIDEIEKKLLGW